MKREMLLAVSVLLAGFIISFGIVSAGGFRSGNNAFVAADEVVDSSLWSAGKNINIAGRVNGDVFCAGQTVTISGTVQGDVICAAQSLIVSGAIEGDLRSAAQTVTLSGSVGKSASVAAQSFVQDSNSTIGVDLSLGSDDAVINGAVSRDALLGGTIVSLGGSIGRNIVAGAEQFNINGNAVIGGNFDYTSNNKAKIDSGAVISGKTRYSKPDQHTDSRKDDSSWLAFSFGTAIYILISWLVVAISLVLLFPQAVNSVGLQGMRRPLKSLLLGFASLVLIPILALLLIFTFLGIPFAMILMVVWTLLIMLSGTAGAYYFAKALWKNQKNPVALMAAGVSALSILCLVPIIGCLAILAALFMGAGMILLQLKSTRPKPAYKL